MTVETDTARSRRLAALLERAQARTLRLIASVASQDPALRHAPPPAIRFDLRGVSAGQFRVERDGACSIRYNPVLLLRHVDDFLSHTVPHETAHYLAYRRHGRGIRPHGPEWQAIMRSLGAAPERCHQYDVRGLSARRVRYFRYHCDCRNHQLSSIRHNKVLRGARYLCRRCGGALRPGSTAERS